MDLFRSCGLKVLGTHSVKALHPKLTAGVDNNKGSFKALIDAKSAEMTNLWRLGALEL